jgi:hypothetical protein
MDAVRKLPPEQRDALIEELEVERQRRLDEKIERGEAVRPPFGSIVVGVGGAIKTAVAAHKARDKRELHLDDGAVLVTGVPRTGRDDGHEIPTLSSPYPHVPYIPRAKTDAPLGPTWDVRSVGEWRHIRAQVRRPDPEKNDPGEIKEGRCRLEGDLLHVEDLEGRRLSLQPLLPGDDIEAAARKVLREKHNRHGAFYDPIRYSTRTFH